MRTCAALALTLLGAGPASAAVAERGISIAWGGDVTLGSSYGLPPERGWPQLAGVAGVLGGADLAAVNYEGTFAPGGASKCGGSRSPTCFAFQAPAANAGTLARAGIDVVNRANNHAFDFGPAGYGSTRRALRAAGVRFTGAPRGAGAAAQRHPRRVRRLLDLCRDLRYAERSPGSRRGRRRQAERSEAAGDACRIMSIHDSARAHQSTRPPGVSPARGAVVVGLPLAGRPLQTLI